MKKTKLAAALYYLIAALTDIAALYLLLRRSCTGLVLLCAGSAMFCFGGALTQRYLREQEDAWAGAEPLK